MSDVEPINGGRLVLVRHGQGSLGSEDYDRLSARGWAQGEQLRLWTQTAGIDGALVCSGDLRRHQETVSAMGWSSSVQINANLNEYTVSHLIEAAIAQQDHLGIDVPSPEALAEPEPFLQAFLAWFPTVLSHWQEARLVCPHNGSWQSFQDRICRPLSTWTHQVSAGQTVVAITSAGVISTLVSLMTEQPLAWQRSLNVSLYNASITSLQWSGDGQWHLEKLNSIEHLSDTALHTLA